MVLQGPIYASPGGDFWLDTLANKRRCVIDQAEFDAKYVREETNRNDHPRIYAYFKAVGFKTPEKMKPSERAWCGAFVGAILKWCGVAVANVKNVAATVSWVTAGKKYIKDPRTVPPEPGDVSIYNFSKRRTGADHVEFVKYWHPNPKFPYVDIIGGNTSDPKKKKSYGVIAKTRLKWEIKSYYSLRALYAPAS